MLTQRYDQLVHAINTGATSPDAALTELHSLHVTDPAGNLWTIDANRTLLRALPGQPPAPTDPQHFTAAPTHTAPLSIPLPNPSPMPAYAPSFPPPADRVTAAAQSLHETRTPGRAASSASRLLTNNRTLIAIAAAGLVLIGYGLRGHQPAPAPKAPAPVVSAPAHPQPGR